MSDKKWYQDYRIATPVAVALIGLVGTVIGLTVKQGERAKPVPKPAQVTPVVARETPPLPELIAFPVVVIDDATEDRLSGTRVSADEQGVSSETDSQGRCTLTVRPGLKKLRVTVSKRGYKTQNVELTVFEGMDSARIRLRR